MANDEHLRILKERGVEAWNTWRQDYHLDNVDLSGADLAGAELSGARLGGANLCDASLIRANLSDANLGYARLTKADLRWANLSSADLSFTDLYEADLRWANLTHAVIAEGTLDKVQFTEACCTEVNLCDARMTRANLSGASLSRANLTRVNLTGAKLTGVDLTGANLTGANLTTADLTGSNLTGADLTEAVLVKTILERSVLNNCRVFGVSAWGVKLEGAEQTGLIITPLGESSVVADNLEIAQFIYLLLTREKLRDIIDTITSKAVLILGRFTSERKKILDTIATTLRAYNLVPIIFDFERSPARDFTETIQILAGLSLFVIVDITNPRSTPLELQASIPAFQIPFVPIIQKGEEPFSMFGSLNKFPWMLRPVWGYQSSDELTLRFKPMILDRAWAKHLELQKAKMEKVEVLSFEDFALKGV